MIGLTSPILWYTARASGIVTLLLFTLVMAMGIMTATRVGGAPLPRFAVAELHRRLSLIAVIFLALHIAASVIDTYVHISVVAIFVPFASAYKPLWVALGTVSLDLILAITLTSLFRQRINHEAWRAIHWLSYLAWPIALIHSIFIGTDIRFGWMDLFVAGCVAIVVASAIWRIWANPHPDGALTAVPDRTAPKTARSAKRAPRVPQQRAAQTSTPIASSSRPKRPPQ
jgi:DMSO/TMAO reductase YedYZ heme-binding membrane subunit